MGIHNREGSFEMDLWVKEDEKEPTSYRKNQRYAELNESDDEDEEESNMDFIRQVC